MFTMVPQSLDEEIGNFLKINQQRLLTHLDLFWSWTQYMGCEDSSYEDGVRKMYNYFGQEAMEGRTCPEANVVDNWCYCKPVQ
jgi:hypothetical protein